MQQTPRLCKIYCVKRRLFNLLAGLSLLLCLAISAMWVRSYWVCDGFLRASNGSASLGRLAWGKVNVLTVEKVDLPKPIPLQYVRWKYVYDGGDYWLAPGAFSVGWEPGSEMHFLGFLTDRGEQDFPRRDKLGQIDFQQRPFTRIAIPYWPALVLTAWPVWMQIPRMARSSVSRLRCRHHRLLNGLCPICGYDLRATPNRCPECGTVPKKSATP